MKYAIKEMAILQEAKDVKVIGSNKVRFKAKLQILDKYSYNGKKYLSAPMKRAINAKGDLLRRNGFIGEMDHPMDPSMMRIVNVLYKNASHIFQEIYTEGNEVWGVLENTSNRVGLDLYAFIVKDKIPVGFSLRALGDVRSTREGQEVYANIDLVTWDTVSTPSFSGCFLQEINSVKHLESYRLKNDLINLEEYVYGNSQLRNEMLMESSMSCPTCKLIEKAEKVCLYESKDILIKTVRQSIKDRLFKKIYSI